MDNQILTTTFDYIEHDQLEELQTYIVEILSQSFEDYRLPWEFIFQRCYLHACLKRIDGLQVGLKMKFIPILMI